MFQTRFHRCCALAAVLTVLACLLSAPAVQAEEPQYVTVALVLPAQGVEPVCVLFGRGEPQGNDALFIGSYAHFGDFSNTMLTPTHALCITRGDRPGAVVRGLSGYALPPNDGVMPLRPGTVELRAFCSRSGAELVPALEESASYLLVIVTAPVH